MVEPGGFATRSGKNPDPLNNGHMAEANPIYDGLRQRLAGFAGKQPAGDPAAAAQALLKIVDSDKPTPARTLRPGLLPPAPAGLRRPAQDLGRLAAPFSGGSRQPRSRSSVILRQGRPLQHHQDFPCPHGRRG
ncbi:hypothetical protein GCM10020219_065430 [Nonomuraea dietziae]